MKLPNDERRLKYVERRHIDLKKPRYNPSWKVVYRYIAEQNEDLAKVNLIYPSIRSTPLRDLPTRKSRLFINVFLELIECQSICVKVKSEVPNQFD